MAPSRPTSQGRWAGVALAYTLVVLLAPGLPPTRVTPWAARRALRGLPSPARDVAGSRRRPDRPRRSGGRAHRAHGRGDRRSRAPATARALSSRLAEPAAPGADLPGPGAVPPRPPRGRRTAIPRPRSSDRSCRARARPASRLAHERVTRKTEVALIRPPLVALLLGGVVLPGRRRPHCGGTTPRDAPPHASAMETACASNPRSRPRSRAGRAARARITEATALPDPTFEATLEQQESFLRPSTAATKDLGLGLALPFPTKINLGDVARSGPAGDRDLGPAAPAADRGAGLPGLRRLLRGRASRGPHPGQGPGPGLPRRRPRRGSAPVPSRLLDVIKASGGPGRGRRTT